jgi:ABC-type Fe3+/spermidine/putrescine transport system ATPase subunit
MSLLEVHHVTKAFGATPVLHGISLAAEAGEIVCLLGPSGCGKTTLLRVIAGLEQPDTGVVQFDGQDLAAAPVHRRGFGLMFQDFALFPHKNVAENVAFGLRMAGQDRQARQRRVAEMLDLVNLAGHAQRRVHELSGGEQQRVALARSLAPSPRLLMLDEPLGSLDRTLREELMAELRRILKQIGVTALYVTHDQQEAFAIADRVLILNAGRIEQEGPPLAVYRQPASRFVAHFLGMHNLLPGRVMSDPPQPQVATAIGTLVCADCGANVAAGDAVIVLVRPDAVTLLAAPDAARGLNSLQGVLANCSFRGSQIKIAVECGLDSRLSFDLPGAAADALPAPGQLVTLQVAPDGLALLPAGESPQSEPDERVAS